MHDLTQPVTVLVHLVPAGESSRLQGHASGGSFSSHGLSEEVLFQSEFTTGKTNGANIYSWSP